jgi:hypothetical protein
MRRAFRSSDKRDTRNAFVVLDDYDARAHPHSRTSPPVAVLRKCAVVVLPSLLMLAVLLWFLSATTVPHSTTFPARHSLEGWRVGSTEGAPGSVSGSTDDTARRALALARTAEPKAWRSPRIVGRARVSSLPSASSALISSATNRGRGGASVLADVVLHDHSTTAEPRGRSSESATDLPESLDSVGIAGLPALNAHLLRLGPMEILRSHPPIGHGGSPKRRMECAEAWEGGRKGHRRGGERRRDGRRVWQGACGLRMQMAVTSSTSALGAIHVLWIGRHRHHAHAALDRPSGWPCRFCDN